MTHGLDGLDIPVIKFRRRQYYHQLLARRDERVRWSKMYELRVVAPGLLRKIMITGYVT